MANMTICNHEDTSSAVRCTDCSLFSVGSWTFETINLAEQHATRPRSQSAPLLPRRTSEFRSGYSTAAPDRLPNLRHHRGATSSGRSSRRPWSPYESSHPRRARHDLLAWERRLSGTLFPPNYVAVPVGEESEDLPEQEPITTNPDQSSRSRRGPHWQAPHAPANTPESESVQDSAAPTTYTDNTSQPRYIPPLTNAVVQQLAGNEMSDTLLRDIVMIGTGFLDAQTEIDTGDQAADGNNDSDESQRKSPGSIEQGADLV